MSARVLFDTHILLWALTGDERLPVKAREMMKDPETAIFYSSVSVWEVAIKHLKNPSKIENVSPEMLINFCDLSGFDELRLRTSHVLMLKTLSRPENVPPRNDPFDRILISQAKSEDMIFLTHDDLLTGYNDSCIICA